MKILIITYSREVNPGTFLQAYGVQYVFHQLYPDARIDLIKHKRIYSITAEGKNANTKGSKLSFVKAKAHAIPRRLKYEWDYRTKFHLTSQEFDFFDYDEEEFKAFAEGYDLIVVGSDTILINLDRNGNYGLMWLRGIDTQKILFAASAAPVNFVLTAEQREELRQSFATFKLLGVRDCATKKLIAQEIGLGDRVYEQDDPTYLIPETEFSLPSHIRRKLENVHKRQKIALVNFGVTGCTFKKELTEFVKSLGYFTISTLYNEDADCNLMSLSPFGWAAMFKYVDLSVTERFHDSVFTLRNGKPVVAIDWNKRRFSKDGFSKTQYLLEKYGLSCNHFIAINIEDARRAMEHIRSLKPEAQKQIIKRHNLKIIDNYTAIMENIKVTLGIDRAINIYSGGVNLFNVYLSSLREQYTHI